MLATAEKRDLRWLLEDPVRFTRGLLRHDPWPMAEQILRSVATNERTAVKACHASSKTYTAAEAVLWWITRYPDGIAVTTAPTWTQVERLLWGEIHKAVQTARIQYPEPLKTELPLGPNNYAVGISTDKGVRFQGWHGRVLIVLDEAPGVRPDIYEAIEGVRAGGQVHLLALGNPTIASGPFYDAFTDNRDGWSTFTISAFDTPNLKGLTIDDVLAMSPEELSENERPYLVTRKWVREKYHEWGPASPMYESRVLGQFPTQAEDALLSLAWLERAGELKPVASDEPLYAGLDVAGPGEDETALRVRQGPNVIHRNQWRKDDPRGEVVADLRRFRGKLKAVRVDAIGIGWYMAKHIEDAGFPVEYVNVGEPARDSEKFANKKAEISWAFRQRAEDGDLGGLTDETEVSQLAGIRYKHNARGQVVIESKDDARKRGVKSPDRAEADLLAFMPDKPERRRAPLSTGYVTG